MKKKAAHSRKAAPKKNPSSSAGGGKLWVKSEELLHLQDMLREAQETLEAIRNGEVDAVVVHGSHGNQIYSLTGAEQPYRVYVEQMQEGAVTVSEDGLILYANQRFATMVAMPLERVISSAILQHLSLNSWDDLTQVFHDIGTTAKHESILHRAGEAPLPVNLTASLLPLEGQSVMCLVVTDLTEQKEREELRLAKEGAEEANVAKDAFIAALSHELRTPLTPALMATMALETDGNLPQTTRQTLAMIRRNIELEARLIDDLLDLTRITRGKLELHVKEMDVHAVIRRAVEICETDLHNKQQRLHLRLEARNTQTHGDAVRLQQTLWNVIRNAVKFTPPGGHITIRTGNEDAGSVWIEISDTGIGFSPETGASMFKAFEQGGREITRRFGGLGLGLAISNSIMESHRGSIRGASLGIGKGASFTLELPLEKRGAASGGSGPHSTAVDAETQGLRILLVEDHNDTRASMEHLLRRSRHTVTSADSAAAALEAASSGQFDLVISDLGLPDLSGTDLMRELRKLHGLSGIAVSGYGMEEDMQRSREAGFVHHLIKPIRMDQLRQVIRDFREG